MSSLGYGNKLDVWEIFAHLFCEPELDGRVVLNMDDKNRVARFPQLLQCWNHSMCPCQQGVVCDVPCRIMVVCEVIIDERSRIPASKGSWSQKIFDTRKRKKENSNVATSMIYVIASISSWSESICNPKTDISRIEGPQRLLPPFEGEHLE